MIGNRQCRFTRPGTVSHKRQTEEKNTNTAQHVVGCHCCKGILLLTCIQLAVPRSSSPKLFSLLWSPTMLLCRMTPAQGLDLALACADVLELLASLFLQPVQDPLNSSPALQHFRCIPQFSSYHRFSECTSTSSFRLLMKTSNSIGISIYPWEMPLAISHRFVSLITTF